MLNIQNEERQLADLLSAQAVTLGELQLSMCEWPAQEGIAFAVNSQGTDCVIWLPANLWQTWCKGLLGTAETSEVDPLLLAGIAEWGLSPLLRASETILTPMSPPLPCSNLPDQIALTISWRTEQSDFRAMLFGWPPSYLKGIAGQITPAIRQIHPTPPIIFPLYLGWCQLSLAELVAVEPGVGIRITCFGDAKAGIFAIQLPGGISALVSLTAENTMKFNELVQDIESLLAQEREVQALEVDQGVNLDCLPQTLLVEVGQAQVELGQLRQLKEGDILPVGGSFSACVTLRMNGRAVGRGELICCGDLFLVRIARWYLKGDTVNT